MTCQLPEGDGCEALRLPFGEVLMSRYRTAIAGCGSADAVERAQTVQDRRAACAAAGHVASVLRARERREAIASTAKTIGVTVTTTPSTVAAELTITAVHS